LPTILSPVEADQLVGALRTHRDRAMVAAMLFGGLRPCEVLGLRFADIQIADRRVFIVEGKAVTTEWCRWPTDSSTRWATISTTSASARWAHWS
jgi:integrase